MARIRFSTRNNLLCSSILSPLHFQSSIPPKTLTMAVNQSNSKRPTCPSCSKPSLLCLCARIRNPGLENKVSVTILQHSLERKHPLNSVRIAKLGLRNVTVVTVSDINFSARFVIQFLESSSGSNGWESLDLDRVLVRKETQKRKFEDFGGFSSGRENMGNGEVDSDLLESCGLVLGTERESRSNDCISAKNSFAAMDKRNEEPVICATIGKNGVISDLDSKWKPQIHSQENPNFDQILASQEAVNALAKGFIVKKLQKQQLNGSINLEEYEEFKLVVPSGSVLLFPSDTAIGIDELQSMNIEVKNLIVLDGTWAKAKRMYKENPWLSILPHLKLNLDKLSLYSEVRSQPKAGCLSTIESIVYALKAVGDNPEGLDSLLDVFESMVVDQRRCKDERLRRASAP